MPEGLTSLDALVRAATVRFLPDDDPDNAQMWGSGFFVAPGWIVTAAHVLLPYLREDTDRPFWAAGDEQRYGVAPTRVRLRQWLVSDVWSDSVPAQRDLALVQLLDGHIDHECVWLGDSAASTGGDRVSFGFRPTSDEDDRVYGLWRGEVRANVDDGAVAVRFGPQAEFPPGVSGGPVLDPATGAVREIVKSGRVGQDGGRAVSAAALRGFGPLYREVMDAHDRWHHARREDTGSWIAHQARLEAAESAGAERWSSDDRVQALNHLAALAPPPEGVVADLASHVRDQRLPRIDPGPVTWRDGHGLLYDEDGRPLPAYVFMHYLRLAALLARGYGADTGRLDSWLARRLHQLPPQLRRLVEQAQLPDTRSAERIVIPYPGPDDPGHIVVVELDELPYGTLHWQIRIDDGSADDEIFAAEEDPNGVVPARLRTHLRDPLVQAFRIADQASGGAPAPCEVVLPASYFDTPVHRWQLADEAPLGDPAHLPVGVRRRIVLRNVDRRGEPDRHRLERWSAAVGSGPFSAGRIPPAGGLLRERHISGLPPSGIPVLCHRAGLGTGNRAMESLLAAGHGIALWRIDGHDSGPCGADCEDLHKGVAEMLAGTGSAPELPDRLRRIREEIHEGRTAGHWAEAVAVLYDDPRRPIPERPAWPVDSP